MQQNPLKTLRPHKAQMQKRMCGEAAIRFAEKHTTVARSGEYAISK